MCLRLSSSPYDLSISNGEKQVLQKSNSPSSKALVWILKDGPQLITRLGLLTWVSQAWVKVPLLFLQECAEAMLHYIHHSSLLEQNFYVSFCSQQSEK